LEFVLDLSVTSQVHSPLFLWPDEGTQIQHYQPVSSKNVAARNRYDKKNQSWQQNQRKKVRKARKKNQTNSFCEIAAELPLSNRRKPWGVVAALTSKEKKRQYQERLVEKLSALSQLFTGGIDGLAEAGSWNDKYDHVLKLVAGDNQLQYVKDLLEDAKCLISDMREDKDYAEEVQQIWGGDLEHDIEALGDMERIRQERNERRETLPRKRKSPPQSDQRAPRPRKARGDDPMISSADESPDTDLLDGDWEVEDDTQEENEFTLKFGRFVIPRFTFLGKNKSLTSIDLNTEKLFLKLLNVSNPRVS